jgi:hypothetical protein
MRIAHHHLQGTMAQQLRHCTQIDAGHHEIAGKVICDL